MIQITIICKPENSTENLYQFHHKLETVGNCYFTRYTTLSLQMGELANILETIIDITEYH